MCTKQLGLVKSAFVPAHSWLLHAHYPFHLRAGYVGTDLCKDIRGWHLGLVTTLLAPALSQRL